MSLPRKLLPSINFLFLIYPIQCHRASWSCEQGGPQCFVLRLFPVYICCHLIIKLSSTVYIFIIMQILSQVCLMIERPRWLFISCLSVQRRHRFFSLDLSASGSHCLAVWLLGWHYLSVHYSHATFIYLFTTPSSIKVTGSWTWRENDIWPYMTIHAHTHK